MSTPPKPKRPDREAALNAKRSRRDALVLQHLPLVRAIALRVHDNVPVHVDLDELIQAGTLGLFDAAERYDPDKSVTFNSYAKHRIKGAILDSLRQADWASRDMRRRHRQLEEVTRELAGQLKRPPTEDEIAGRLGVHMEKWRQMMVDLQSVGLVSASTRRSEDEDLPPPDFLADPASRPDNIASREQLRTAIDAALRALPERYRKVIAMYYGRELTMREIGAEMGINESRVSQIHKAALERMLSALEAAGITSSCAF